MHNSAGTFVGQAVPARDSWSKATAGYRFLSDQRFEGDLWAGVVRSPHPRARFVDIDVAESPSLVAVYTAQDVPQCKFNPALAPDSEQLRAARDKTLLTAEARHVGDGVAVVVTTSRDAVESAVRTAKVGWEPLASILDIDTALKHGRTMGSVELGTSEVERALGSSELVVEEAFEIASAQHICLETHWCRAAPDGKGVAIWSNTQSPGRLRYLVAETLAIPCDLVRIRKIGEGGGFGNRQEMYEEALVAWIAQRLNRPVSLGYRRDEEMHAGRRRHGAQIGIRLGVSEGGYLSAVELDAVLDAGAYASHSPYVAGAIVATAAAAYPRAVHRARCEVVSTDTAPTGAYRGYGSAQATFALEVSVGQAARRAGIDPVALRLRSAPSRVQRCLRLGSNAFGWPRPRSNGSSEHVRGHGVAVGSKGTVGRSGDQSSAMLTVSDDGSAILYSGTCDCGTGSSTVMAQIVADELGVGLDRVRIVEGDTALGPVDIGSTAQRSACVGGEAARRAAIAAREGRKEPVEAGSGPLPASACACFVAVAVDVELGSVTVEEALLVIDCGRVLNPLGAHGQAHGGFVQAVGLALIDLWAVDDAGSGPPSILQHGVPTSVDAVSPTVIFVDEPVSQSELGALGLGELSVVPVAAAIADAVYDATGTVPRTLPMRPSAVWEAVVAGRGAR